MTDNCALICARWTVAWSYCSDSCANDCCCVANSASTASTWAWVALMAAPVPDCPEAELDDPGDATATGVASDPTTMIVDTRRAAPRATVCVRARRNRPVTTVTLTTVARAPSGRKGRSAIWRFLDLLGGYLYLAFRGGFTESGHFRRGGDLGRRDPHDGRRAPGAGRSRPLGVPRRRLCPGHGATRAVAAGPAPRVVDRDPRGVFVGADRAPDSSRAWLQLSPRPHRIGRRLPQSQHLDAGRRRRPAAGPGVAARGRVHHRNRVERAVRR